ncbi:hypothetical protein TNCV_1455101 [Trichonephila clavipes]|nr:hypothetical protein TNCV_1455101 [Trichonephila clavipes]
MIPPAHKAHQTVSFSGCNGVSTYTCGLASLQWGSLAGKTERKKSRTKEKERARKRRELVVLGSGDEDPGVLVRDADQEPEREEEKTPCGLYRDKLWRERLQNGATILARHGDYQLHKLI